MDTGCSVTERHIIAAVLIALLLIGGTVAIWRTHRNSDASRAKRRERDYWAEEKAFRTRGDERS